MRFQWFKKLSPALQLLVLTGLTFLLLGLYVISAKYLRPTLASCLSLPTQFCQDVSFNAQAFLRFQDLTEENARLQNEINQLKAQTAQLQEASLENQRLRNLLSLPQGTQFKSISALVVAKDSSNLTRTIVISQGSLNGVKPGMSVIFGAGLVGRVIETFPGSSKVALLTDFNSKIPAKIQRTREEGVVLGTLKPGQNICQIKYIHDAQIGDKVISSGLGGRCPKGLLIGEIIAVTDDESGLYKIAQIRSEVDFSTLEEAMIILE